MVTALHWFIPQVNGRPCENFELLLMGDEELKNDFASSVNVLNNNLFVVHDI